MFDGLGKQINKMKRNKSWGRKRVIDFYQEYWLKPLKRIYRQSKGCLLINRIWEKLILDGKLLHVWFHIVTKSISKIDSKLPLLMVVFLFFLTIFRFSPPNLLSKNPISFMSFLSLKLCQKALHTAVPRRIRWSRRACLLSRCPEELLSGAFLVNGTPLSAFTLS